MVTEEPADFEPRWREGGVVPRRSGSAIGVASEVILRATVWRRGHRGAGRGGSSEGSGSSRSTSAQQQHQKNNPGSSGSGSGGAAPQRTVQVDESSTTASAPAVPSAAAPGAMPAAAPGVSSVSDAWKLSPWSAGWSAYPPAVPFESSGASPPAQLARPWRQVGPRRLEMRMKCPWSSRISMFPLSCAFLVNARGEPLHFERSWTRALISRVCRCR